jgi:nucleotide-binding universal stress UspA family protein
VRTVEQHGDPARTIVLHANARKADLVVLGSNRRRGWQRFREGSVGERVLRRAAWAVLVVPWDAP